MDIVEAITRDLRRLGVLEGVVTPDYVKRDVDQALQAAHIEKADVEVVQKNDTISVTIQCRNASALKEAGQNVIKHLEGEEVPTSNASFEEVGDGVWQFSFDAKVVEPQH